MIIFGLIKQAADIFQGLKYKLHYLAACLMQKLYNQLEECVCVCV